jgi:LL-diaminopimelate aminotransferase
VELRPSDRLLETPPYPFAALAARKRELVAKGADLIDFGIGDPDLPTPAHIVEALCRAAHDPATHRYDESGLGIPELRSAIAAWYEKRFGVALNPENEILRLIGSKDGIAHLPWAVINPGDIALIPDPAYPVYLRAVRFAGGEPHIMPLLPEAGYLPDLDAITANVASRAKIMWLCYPNQPTAAVCDLDFYRRVVAFAERHKILVALDLAYSEVTFDGYIAPSILQVDGAKEVAIEFHSLSKTYSMTGWRIGFAVGNAPAIKALGDLKSNVDSGVFAAIQHAAVAALTGPQDCVQEMREEYRKRRDILVDGLRAMGCPVEKPKGSFYVWAPVPAGTNSAEFAEMLLSEAGIISTPGSAYGKYGEGFVRFSLTVEGGKQGSQARVREAVARMRDKVKASWQ